MSAVGFSSPGAYLVGQTVDMQSTHLGEQPTPSAPAPHIDSFDQKFLDSLQLDNVRPEAIGQEDVVITDPIRMAVQGALPKFHEARSGTTIEGAKIFTSQASHFVFTLDAAPGIIFKMVLENPCLMGANCESDEMKTRHEKANELRALCEEKEWDCLVIPKSTLFEVDYKGKKAKILAERMVDVTSEHVQPYLYEQLGDKMHRALGQLADFIAETGWSDVGYANAPILRHAQAEDGSCKLGLIDLEEFTSAKGGLTGITGFLPRTGLIELARTDEQRRLIEGKCGAQTDITDAELTPIMASTQALIDVDRAFLAFLAKMPLRDARQPIAFDCTQLDSCDDVDAIAGNKCIQGINESLLEEKRDNWPLLLRRKVFFQGPAGSFIILNRRKREAFFAELQAKGVIHSYELGAGRWWVRA